MLRRDTVQSIDYSLLLDLFAGYEKFAEVPEMHNFDWNINTRIEVPIKFAFSPIRWYFYFT